MKSFFKAAFVSVLLIPSLTLASKPEQGRTLEQCQAMVRGFGSRGTDYFSSSSLIPLSQLLGTKYCQQIIKNHIEGEINNKSFPTAGLAEMFLTARTAADELIESLGIEAKRPSYQQRDILQGAEETLRMIFEDKPEFIREGVLVRDGVVMVVPLLYRVSMGSKKQAPLYLPIYVKGHQELEKFDVLGAAFAAWALGPYLGRIPSEAWVHLKPMAKKRNPNWRKMRDDEIYKVDVPSQLPAVELIHQEFLKTLSDPQKLADIKPRRCVQCNSCPWAAHCRAIMNENNDLSMMPYPPTEETSKKLGEIGYGTMDRLATLDVNSDAFIEVSIYAGIKPTRLYYWVTHAMAKISDTPILTNRYSDPFDGVKHIQHVDYEDALHRDIRSGVYLFGVVTETQGKVKNKEFIFAPTLDQKGVDEAWAGYIRYLKKNKWIKSSEFLKTMFSPHELIKFHQQFDVLLQPVDKFTDSQKRSPYYAEGEELADFATEEDAFFKKPLTKKKVGRLIRERAFFRKNRDITPQDVFRLMDLFVDLLEPVRWNFAFPTHSNGLKHILPYVTKDLGVELKYPDGWNGLESVAWAKKAYQTGEHSILEMIRQYNDIDIVSNYLVTKFLRKYAEQDPNPRIVFQDATLEIMTNIQKAAEARNVLENLEEKDELLERILGRSVADLSGEEIEELADIVDRTEYLGARQKIENSTRLDDREKEQELQMLQHNNENVRKTRLMAFFKKARAYKKEKMSDEVMDEIAKLFLFHPTTFMLPTHLFQMVALSEMQRSVKHLTLLLPKDPRKRIFIPDSWSNAFTSVWDKLKSRGLTSNEEEDEEDETPRLTRAQARKIWDGLYFEKAFDGTKIRR